MKDIVMDNFRIEALALRSELVAAFPFFGTRVVRDENCCSHHRRHRNHVDYAQVKNALVALPDAAKTRFKEMIGARSVTVYLPAGTDGVVKALRF